MLFGGRYELLLMSVFSIYRGLIYNEFFYVPFHIFGASAYKCRDTSCRYLKFKFSFPLSFSFQCVHNISSTSYLWYLYVKQHWCIYNWFNQIWWHVSIWCGSWLAWKPIRATFLNSLKMKMSILFGVAQMNLGIFLSYFNSIFFNNSLDIRYQFGMDPSWVLTNFIWYWLIFLPKFIYFYQSFPYIIWLEKILIWK